MIVENVECWSDSSVSSRVESVKLKKVFDPIVDPLNGRWDY